MSDSAWVRFLTEDLDTKYSSEPSRLRCWGAGTMLFRVKSKNMSAERKQRRCPPKAQRAVVCSATRNNLRPSLGSRAFLMSPWKPGGRRGQQGKNVLHPHPRYPCSNIQVMWQRGGRAASQLSSGSLSGGIQADPRKPAGSLKPEGGITWNELEPER